jgi:hypothetical protein
MGDLLTVHDLPKGFDYPSEFLHVVERGLLELEPWRILTGDLLRRRAEGLGHRYPERMLVPFAARQDNDDVACWDTSLPGQVVIVHDFSSGGWEGHGGFPDFVSWLQSVFNEFIEWIP